jgi:hypothetical protein
LSCQHDVEARLKEFALSCPVENFSQFALQVFEPAKGIGGFEKINILFGKIQCGFNQHA